MAKCATNVEFTTNPNEEGWENNKVKIVAEEVGEIPGDKVREKMSNITNKMPTNMVVTKMKQTKLTDLEPKPKPKKLEEEAEEKPEEELDEWPKNGRKTSLPPEEVLKIRRRLTEARKRAEQGEKKEAEEKKKETKEKKKEIEEKKKGAARQASQRDLEGRRQRARYLELKKRAKDGEPNNYSKLFFIHQKNGWFRGFGHTAIIFHYVIAPKIGINCSIKPDQDYDLRIEGGVVNIRSIDNLEAKLAAAKIQRIAGDATFRIYRLNKKYTQAEIAAMEATKDREWAKVNHVIRPVEAYPKLFYAEVDLLKRAYFKVRLLDEQMRKIFGNDIVKRAGEVMREYALLTKGIGMSSEEYLDYVENSMDWIEAQMVALAEIQAMPPEKMYQILFAAEVVKREVASCKKGK